MTKKVLVQILCYMFKMFYSWQEIYDSDVSFVDWPSKGWNANIWAFKHQRALCLFCLDLEMLKSLSEAELFSFSVPLCGEYFCIAEYFRCKESKFVWCKLANLWRLLKLKLLAYLLLWKYLLQWKCDTWIFGALQMWWLTKPWPVNYALVTFGLYHKLQGKIEALHIQIVRKDRSLTYTAKKWYRTGRCICACVFF